MRRAVPLIGRVGEFVQAALIMLSVIAIGLAITLAVVVLFNIAIAEQP